MKLLVLFLSFLPASTALAQTIVQACKDKRGEIYYKNSPTLKKNCEKVENESLSVIPSDSRKSKLPISIGMSQDQVRNNWGNLKKIIKFETRTGSTEQWEYGKSTLTFANGVLEAIQH